VSNGFKIASSPSLSVAGHSTVASLSCVSCHENNPTNLGFQGVANKIYLRPGAAIAGLSPVDLAHVVGTLLSADCAQCHTTSPPFAGGSLSANHIPLPTPAPACSTCHAAGYSPTLSKMVHSVVASETCVRCHGKNAAGSPFSGTGQGTGGQPYQQPGAVGTPGSGNHIPIGSADCKSCHATSDTETATGTGFRLTSVPALTAAGHGAVSSVSCASCHGSGMVWFGVTIKTPPGTVGTSGAGNHIPIGSTACNVCHANTNYVSFAGTAMNHAGITSGCSNCHNAGKAWYGVTIKTSTLTPAHIPVAATSTCEACHSVSNFTAFGPGTAMNPATHLQVPTSLEPCTTCHENGKATAYYGVTIVTRPTAATDPQHPPAPQDCANSGCHTTTPPFTGGVEPPNHIPSSKTCSNCHTGYTPATTTMNHADPGVGTAGSPVACVTCHGYGNGNKFYGTAQGMPGGWPMMPPGTSGGGPSKAQHVPFGTVACNICHTSTTVPGGFKGTIVPHTNGPFMTYTRGNRTPGSGSSAPYKCNACHAPSGTSWFGVSLGTKTEGNHEGSTTASDCIDCHNAQGGFAAAAAAAARRPMLSMKIPGANGAPGTSAAPTSGMTVRPPRGPAPPTTGVTPRAAGGATPPPAVGPYSHMGVIPGSCASCHRPGGSASATPGGHLRTTLSCDACHRTTAWKPVTYAHAGVGPGRCASCHTGNWATPRPAGHFVTARSCDACHHSTTSWTPVLYDHLSPRYRPQPGIVRCLDCHTTNTEMVIPSSSRPGSRRAMPGAGPPVRTP
jgi:hypothetical protein